MSSQYEVRVGYINALSGLSHNGVNVQAFDEIMSLGIAPKYYMILSGQSSTDDSKKCGFESIDIISINIISTYALGSGSKKDVEMIAESVKSRIISTPGHTDIITPSYHIWDTRLISDKNNIYETSNERKVIKILTFQHRITKNS